MLFQRILLCVIVAFLTAPTQAQKTNNVWAFGEKSGFNFNTPTVSLFKSNAETKEPPYYFTSICDEDGNLKFYTDGINIWNRDNFPLPVYRNWWPWSEKAMPLICPYPSSDSMYYLFGISAGMNAKRLQYLTIKMRKAGDIEEAVYPQPTGYTTYYTTLVDNASMLLAGTAHCNEKDKWIVAHTPGALNSFLVTKDGVNPSAVVSPIPVSVVPFGEINAWYSNIKFSANGERLVIPVVAGNKVVVMDFDNMTGRFSNALSLNLPADHQLEDVELSPDASKLYVGAFTVVDQETLAEMHYVFQMDLNAGTPAQIEATTMAIAEGDRAACSPRGSCVYVKRMMQLGPDGKIYVSMKEYTTTNLDRTVSVIEAPNKKGLDSRYRRKLVDLNQQYKYLNYNYIRSGSFSLKENGISIQKKTCADQPVEFGLLFNRVDSVKWDFGDTASGESNFSRAFTPQHRYPGPGTYTARAIIYIRCLTDTASREVTILPDRSVQIPDHIHDTVECLGNQLTLDAKTAGATAYTWENGLIYSTRTLDTAGRYAITVFNECSMDRREFILKYEPCPCEVFTPNAFTPNNDGLNDHFRPVVQCSAKDYRFRVYNRYGGVAFQSSEPGKGWNGKAGILESPSGVYLWTLQYRNPNTKELFFKKGTVVLIR